MIDNRIELSYDVCMDTDEKKTTYIYFRCSDELKRELIEIANKNDRSLSNQCVYFLKRAIEQYRLGSG